jgi:hypothetical protein
VAALSGALVEAPDWDWLSPRTLALAALAVLSGVWFFRRSLRHPRPLLELHLLRLPRFGVAGLVWSLAAALTLATAAVGLLLSRTPRATPVPEPALT